MHAREQMTHRLAEDAIVHTKSKTKIWNPLNLNSNTPTRKWQRASFTHRPCSSTHEQRREGVGKFGDGRKSEHLKEAVSNTNTDSSPRRWLRPTSREVEDKKKYLAWSLTILQRFHPTRWEESIRSFGFRSPKTAEQSPRRLREDKANRRHWT